MCDTACAWLRTRRGHHGRPAMLPRPGGGEDSGQTARRRGGCSPQDTGDVSRDASRLRASGQLHPDTVVSVGTRPSGGAAWVARVCHGALRLSRGMPEVVNAVCPPPSPGAGQSHSERVSLGPGPCPQRWYAVSPVPARGGWAPEPTRSVGGVGGMQFALITGERRRAPGWQEHAVGARGEANPVHRLPGASAQFASLFLASLPRHVRRSGGFQDTCERTRFVPDAPRTR